MQSRGGFVKVDDLSNKAGSNDTLEKRLFEHKASDKINCFSTDRPRAFKSIIIT